MNIFIKMQIMIILIIVTKMIRRVINEIIMMMMTQTMTMQKENAKDIDINDNLIITNNKRAIKRKQPEF